MTLGMKPLDLGIAGAHPVSGVPLVQPSPSPRRRFAVFDKRGACDQHSLTRFGRSVVRCDLCGTCWDRAGHLVLPSDRRYPDPRGPHVTAEVAARLGKPFTNDRKPLTWENTLENLALGRHTH